MPTGGCCPAFLGPQRSCPCLREGLISRYPHRAVVFTPSVVENFRLAGVSSMNPALTTPASRSTTPTDTSPSPEANFKRVGRLKRRKHDGTDGPHRGTY